MQPSLYRFYYHTISFHYLCRRFSWVKMSDRVRCKELLGIVAIKAPRRMFWSCLATFAATDRILEAAWLPNSACTPVHFYNNKWTLWFLTFWSVLRSKLQAPVIQRCAPSRLLDCTFKEGNFYFNATRIVGNSGLSRCCAKQSESDNHTSVAPLLVMATSVYSLLP